MNSRKPPGAATSAPRGGTGRPAPHRRPWRPLLALAGCLAVAVVLLVRFAGSPPSPPAQEPPRIDFGTMDPSVAATVTRHLEMVRREPGSGTGWGNLGLVLREYGFRSEAQTCLQRAAELDPQNPRWPYAQALLLLTRSPAEAEASLRRTVTLCGNEPEAPRFRLARCLAEQGRWRDADRELEALLSARQGFAPARLLLALNARSAGDATRAITLASECTEDPRTRRAAWALLASLHRLQGDAAAAEQAARRSATLPVDEGFADPFEAEAMLLRGDARALTDHAHPLLAAGRITEAARLIDRLKVEHPAYPETWLLVGRLGILRRDAALAEGALRRHLEMSPRSAQGWFQLGLLLLNEKRFRESAEASRRAIDIKQDFGPAYFNRAVALARGGQPAAAVASFEETIRHNPEHFESYVLLADLLLQLRRPDEVPRLLETAATLRPSDPRLDALRRRAGQPAE